MTATNGHRIKEIIMDTKSISLLPFYVQEKHEAPWSLAHINAIEMWRRGYTGQGAVVAVLDTGCNVFHPYIKHSIIGGVDFTSSGKRGASDVSDMNGHGTHVCGIISAAHNRKNGMSGVAPDAKLLVLKVLNEDGSGDIEPILKALRFAVNWRGTNGKRVNVIGMSFGTKQHYPELEEAVDLASQRGILVVTAAGNDGDGNVATGEILYPGYYGSVLQVGASDINDKPAYFSNSNKRLDIVAPGVDILSLGMGNSYTVMSGTSMACPHVIGGAALIISYYLKTFGKYPTREQIISTLIKNTRRLNYSSQWVGYGLLDLDIFKGK
ncbi:MAG: serine protease [Clostridiales bacterium]|nr:serine protease [Clostridiales bacterium]